MVGVADSGIDGNHPDLEYRLKRNMCIEINEDYFQNVSITMTPNPTDDSDEGHGTHVAGIIAAQGVNNGITGVCQNVRLVSIKIVDNSDYTTENKAIAAINFANDNDIPILNFSIRDFSNSAGLKESIENYYGLFVCLAGNNYQTNINPNQTPNYPGSFGCMNQITVGSIDENGEISNFSNIGSISVHLFAPGKLIISTLPGNSYGYCSGTSMAAPYVSGVAALMLAADRNLTTGQIKSGIINNVDVPLPVNPYQGNCSTNGRLNAFKAVVSVILATSTFNNGVTLDGFVTGYNLLDNVELTLPGKFAKQGSSTQQQTRKISYSAFSNLTQLSKIIIPQSITHIEEYAFYNTNNAPIFIEGRTSVPNTFDTHWNFDDNPVFLNGIKCNHLSKMYINITYDTHTRLCSICRSAKIESHNHTNSYVPIENTSGVKKHEAYCKCGNYKIMPCLFIGQFPDEPVYCLFCGREA